MSDARVMQWTGSAFRTAAVGGSHAYDAIWLAPSTVEAWVVGEQSLARRRVP